jgi:hypothetical protein
MTWAVAVGSHEVTACNDVSEHNVKRMLEVPSMGKITHVSTAPERGSGAF